MDKYSNRYMKTHCIDLFFLCGSFPIHVLTAGSIIPDYLNNILRNRTLQETTALNGTNAEQIAISVNNSYVQTIIANQRKLRENSKKTVQCGAVTEFPMPSIEQITHHFCFYANQGFYSYDCEAINDDGSANYRLIAWPKKDRQIEFELPRFTPSGFGDCADSRMPPESIIM